jgi:hypothetical protein
VPSSSATLKRRRVLVLYFKKSLWLTGGQFEIAEKKKKKVKNLIVAKLLFSSWSARQRSLN